MQKEANGKKSSFNKIGESYLNILTENRQILLIMLQYDLKGTVNGRNIVSVPKNKQFKTIYF